MTASLKDDIRYNRQSYVLGEGAMNRLATSSVFLSGFGSLGVEIAKNLVLMGIKKLTINDTKIATLADLQVNFFLAETAIPDKINRVVGSMKNLKKLNPDVEIIPFSQHLELTDDFSFLQGYQCVILTEAELNTQIMINEFCRSQTPAVKFVSADVFGILGWIFCDFGTHHEVWDTDGEEPKEAFISHISETQPIVVTLDDNHSHGFSCGDYVTFKEVKGMTYLNGTVHRIVKNSHSSFQIDSVPNYEYCDYLGGGRCQEVKLPILMSFESLSSQLNRPTFVDTMDNYVDNCTCHLSFITLHEFFKKRGRLPNPWSPDDLSEFKGLSSSQDICFPWQEDFNHDLMYTIAKTASGIFPPLSAFLGGVIAQEALKAVTLKFKPINQILYFNVADVVPDEAYFKSIGLDSLQLNRTAICIGSTLAEELKSFNVLMAGCGAVGCEMLKNLSLLNIGIRNGQVTVSDHDFVEKSNLSRQFLFTDSSIRKSKSVAAAEAIHKLRPDMNVVPYELRVGPETEGVFNEQFFKNQHVIISALDNVEGRRYLDRQCVRVCRPLIDSGTMATKGHVQIILPHFTESYSSQSDPVDQEIPYCTLKSFPTQIAHTVQWARDKFEALFLKKPEIVKNFWEKRCALQEILERLDQGLTLDNVNADIVENISSTLNVILKQRPKTWENCLKIARTKFEKYFNHKAKHLRLKFPPDMKLNDGSFFWQPPRHLPNPIEFDPQNSLHIDFILSTARLLAVVWQIQVDDSDTSINYIKRTLSSSLIPEFKPNFDKHIETDEQTMSRMVLKDAVYTDFNNCVHQLRAVLQEGSAPCCLVAPQQFDKDNDDNGHIDFVSSASNLRAIMYNLESAERSVIRRISGRIIPAIITTTSAVAGLATVEFVRLAKKSPKEKHKNCFINLALPLFVFSEPASAPVVVVGDRLKFTLWDKWEVHGNQRFSLMDFLNNIQEKYGVRVTMVLQGTKIIYMPCLPGHFTKLKLPMLTLVTFPPNAKCVELSVSIELSHDEEKSGPPVKYYVL